jgi:hypothetical protein
VQPPEGGNLDVKPYLADITSIDTDVLLDDWRWLLGGQSYAVFRVTAMGDLILQDMAERFHLLDMIDGKLRPLASTESELWAVLTDRSTRKTLLGTFVVRGLREAGITIGPGECYSPDHPPILGGSLSNDNLHPCDILVHASIMGQIHRQVRSLPPGTPIGEIRFEPPGDRTRRYT